MKRAIPINRDTRESASWRMASSPDKSGQAIWQLKNKL
jgi:hypothetical protein